MKNGVKKGFLLVKIDFAFLPTTFIVYRALVHCRVGSLEMHKKDKKTNIMVHCRVGSLETLFYSCEYNLAVHCRVGSLENKGDKTYIQDTVHCRVGSLENALQINR